jgi:hypothetical protein
MQKTKKQQYVRKGSHYCYKDGVPIEISCKRKLDFDRPLIKKPETVDEKTIETVKTMIFELGQIFGTVNICRIQDGHFHDYCIENSSDSKQILSNILVSCPISNLKIKVSKDNAEKEDRRLLEYRENYLHSSFNYIVMKALVKTLGDKNSGEHIKWTFEFCSCRSDPRQKHRFYRVFLLSAFVNNNKINRL